MIPKIYIIGIGYKSLNKRERNIIYNSKCILSSSRLFDVFKRYREFSKVKKKILVIDNVDETINFIKSNMGKRVKRGFSMTVLASGDPLFFGIGRRIINELGKDRVEIIPDLSSVQIAFARIKEPWDDAFLMSIHRGPDPKKRRNLKYEVKNIPALLKKHRKIGILTDRENNPSEIAKLLILSPTIYHQLPVMYVCERLGYPDEKVTKGSPEDIAIMSFSCPNVVVVILRDRV